MSYDPKATPYEIVSRRMFRGEDADPAYGFPTDRTVADFFKGQVDAQRRADNPENLVGPLNEVDRVLSRHITPGVLSAPDTVFPMFGTVRDAPKQGDFFSGFTSGLKDTVAGSILGWWRTRSMVEAAVGEIVPDPDYDFAQDPRLKDPAMADLKWLFARSQSANETTMLMQQIEQRKADQLEMSQQGDAAAIGRFIGGMADPIMAFTPQFTGAKIAAKPFYGSLSNGVKFAAFNAAATLAGEAAKKELDPTYDASGVLEAMALAGGVGFIAGHLTGTARGLNERHGIPRSVREGLEQTFPDMGIDMPEPGTVRSMGAAAVPGMAGSRLDQLLEAEALKETGVGLEKLPLNPALRLLQSSSLRARQLVAEMVDLGGMKQRKNVMDEAGVAEPTAVPVEADIARQWKARSMTALQDMQAAWLEARTGVAAAIDAAPTQAMKMQLRDWWKGEGRLTWAQFDERVAKAMRRGDTDPVLDQHSPFVNKAAASVRKYMDELKAAAEDPNVDLFGRANAKTIEKLKAEVAALKARQANLVEIEAAVKRLDLAMGHAGKTGTQSTALSYFTRYWNQNELIKREGEFVSRVKAVFERSGMDPGEALKVAKNVHETLTRSGFRTITEEAEDFLRQVTDPMSSKMRSLQINDLEIEDFLESSAVLAVRHQAATFAPAIELTRRFGDATMERQIAAIQDQYAQLHAKAANTAERTALNRRMAQDIEDVQALRDRLLNVAGASKDPHSWDQRTIRMLKHYMAWTTMGLSAFSQLGDLFRPAITEGLDAVHRHGFGTLMDESRKTIMGMARQERLLCGDSLEVVLASKAMALSDIGDVFASRSNMERQANRFTGLFYMLNGMNHATDLTKDWASVIIQGNINDSLRKWAHEFGTLQRKPRESAAFTEFMKDNKFLDENGQPIYVVHGTPNTFDRFDDAKRGSNTSAENAKQGHFFTSHPDVANAFATEFGSGAPNVRPSYLRMKNPKVIEDTPVHEVTPNELMHRMAALDDTEVFTDIAGKKWSFVRDEDGSVVNMFQGEAGEIVERIKVVDRDLDYGKEIAAAKAAGHDGLVMRNTVDGPAISNVYVVFDPKDIMGFDQRWHPEDLTMARAGETMKERLRSLSIDGTDAIRIAKMLEEHGVQFKSVRLANTEEWTDTGARDLYRQAFQRALQRTVVTPGAGDRPTWMTTATGSLIGQFRSFGMSSAIRTLYAGLQDRDRTFWTGAAVLVGAGVVLNEIRNQVFSGRSSFDQPYLGALADGVDRSGVLGAFMDVNNAIETGSNNRLGFRPLLGAARNYPTTPERMANAFLGPAAGKAFAAADQLGRVVNGDFTARTWRGMRQFGPLQNHPLVDPLADRVFPR